VGEALPDVNVGAVNVSSLMLLVGDCTAGAVTFKVAPDGGFVGDTVGVVGVRAFDFAHANESASKAAVASTGKLLCCIYCSIVLF
jgi:hypothetical protein